MQKDEILRQVTGSRLFYFLWFECQGGVEIDTNRAVLRSWKRNNFEEGSTNMSQ